MTSTVAGTGRRPDKLGGYSADAVANLRTFAMSVLAYSNVGVGR